MIQMIVMDMDGTLLTSENKISPKTKELLLRVQQQGVRLVLASGRSYCKLLEYAKELCMEAYGGYLLEVNGLILYDLASGKRHIRKQMGRIEMEELFTYFRQWDVEFMAQFDDGLYDYNPESIIKEKAEYRRIHNLGEDYPWTGGAFALLADNRKGYPNIHYIDTWEEIDRRINKVSIAYHADVMAEVSAQAKRDLKDRYWLGLTTPKWLELMPLGITKGSGLQALVNMLGISMRDVMAFGDGENDIEMLQAAGIGIAMGNAMAEVKAAADEETDSNNDEGIFKALQKYFAV
ncbi:Cof-type HAD-IIB family hydrolase [[Clostridium] innocuum]|nr:HAD family phosphatase [Erysipelotrichaceae bacterium]MCR0382419.1 Cof-type HAD-IIB family hydrolase [[Clostridium] innocuum]MCR0411766.1 Cof-type HAD-IIB family hydrolase [[Clostridium] innocuum]MCR0533061.1 Cof-type HAD-IIB family hydrolase [[Clostridium] innocuum]MCR0538066.1 Cof-type HAD-IIB family hydrolase [[Clostridium] innocuum]